MSKYSAVPLPPPSHSLYTQAQAQLEHHPFIATLTQVPWGGFDGTSSWWFPSLSSPTAKPGARAGLQESELKIGRCTALILASLYLLCCGYAHSTYLNLLIWLAPRADSQDDVLWTCRYVHRKKQLQSFCDQFEWQCLTQNVYFKTVVYFCLQRNRTTVTYNEGSSHNIKS